MHCAPWGLYMILGPLKRRFGGVPKSCLIQYRHFEGNFEEVHFDGLGSLPAPRPVNLRQLWPHVQSVLGDNARHRGRRGLAMP